MALNCILTVTSIFLNVYDLNIIQGKYKGILAIHDSRKEGQYEMSNLDPWYQSHWDEMLTALLNQNGSRLYNGIKT